MKLPKMPDPLEWESGYEHPTLYYKRQMRAYGKECFNAALVLAAEIARDQAVTFGKNAADYNDGCWEAAGAIERLLPPPAASGNDAERSVK